MRLYTFRIDDVQLLGVGYKGEDCLYPLSAYEMEFADMNDLIENITPAQMELLSRPPKDAQPYKLDQLKICSPIPHPRQDVICLGLNYSDHEAEAVKFSKGSFQAEHTYPIYFAKRAAETVADQEDVPSYPGLVAGLDYEVELAVIIGKCAKDVPLENAYQHVFGYTIINDVSARNIQTRHKQWYFGKSLDGFTPLGPCIVTADEFDAPPALDIRCYINGELRQSNNTRNFITDIAHVINELSQGIRLLPGTIIATGTPSGVGMGFTPPKYLKPGDVMVCEIEGIGKLTNTVR